MRTDGGLEIRGGCWDTGEIVMAEWQPIKTAPKDGQIILSHLGRLPVMVAWVDKPPTKETRTTGIWPFRKSETTERDESGWRVLMLTRHQDYGLHGNYPPFHPTYWMPLYDPPEKTDD